MENQKIIRSKLKKEQIRELLAEGLVFRLVFSIDKPSEITDVNFGSICHQQNHQPKTIEYVPTDQITEYLYRNRMEICKIINPKTKEIIYDHISYLW